MMDSGFTFQNVSISTYLCGYFRRKQNDFTFQNVSISTQSSAAACE